MVWREGGGAEEEGEGREGRKEEGEPLPVTSIHFILIQLFSGCEHDVCEMYMLEGYKINTTLLPESTGHHTRETLQRKAWFFHLFPHRLG